MKLVYICSQYSGDIKNNVKNARKYSRFAVDKGVIPIAPHLLFPQFMNEETERTLAMHFNDVLLSNTNSKLIHGMQSDGSPQRNADSLRLAFAKQK